jgi:hypothetical protein
VDLDLDFSLLLIGFMDAAAVAVAVVVVAAASSSPAELLSPIMVAAVVLVVGAMDGRAAFSDPRPPAVSSSFSLRFSLRACDFEYGVRDASNPVTTSTTTHRAIDSRPRSDGSWRPWHAMNRSYVAECGAHTVWHGGLEMSKSDEGPNKI